MLRNVLLGFMKERVDNVLVINFVTDMWGHMVVQKTPPKPPWPTVKCLSGWNGHGLKLLNISQFAVLFVQVTKKMGTSQTANWPPYSERIGDDMYDSIDGKQARILRNENTSYSVDTTTALTKEQYMELWLGLVDKCSAQQQEIDELKTMLNRVRHIIIEWVEGEKKESEDLK